ncbi:MAG TPA: 16S rRNA (cytidine(1402)-2'-O)-methyltransferase [Leucothrix mucor]|uniref:Ribosomal RNA small subunit methyltransferase I n=1 Tax=Leucothrix mucor TaxID=45248 RepID=A0A7V2WTZ7_LEUMU|nr:16S rRNA (cytidine(1402)-2'-O)-methyltransferase [Leucothrix mucor]
MSNNTPEKQGALYIVATPIGNLADITQRAIETLSLVDRVCAEDTRNTRKLLTHLGIKKTLVALHDHNETQKIDSVAHWLSEGENIALVSDAGTPLISDPGYHLVKALRKMDFQIVPIPGASAIISALSAAGLATNKFSFEGFLPAKEAGRKQALLVNIDSTYTQVYYESSHRIVHSIATMLDVFGADKKVVLARELTKLYEQFFYGTLGDLHSWLVEDKMHQKGEFVIMLAATEAKKNECEVMNSTIEQVLATLIEELPLKQAAKIAAKLTGISKNALYKQGLKLQQK